MPIKITKAEYLGNFKIRLSFNDDSVKNIDFNEFLVNAKNPMTQKYLDEKLFSSYTVKYGDLIWNDYEMCFPIWDLYNNTI